MLLVVDAGNTNITTGVFEGEKLLSTFRLTTGIPRTSDEYGVMIREIISNNNIDHTKVDGCIIASVVPNIMYSLTSGIIKYFGIRPMIVSQDLHIGIKVNTLNPRQLGADRLVDACAAFRKYGGPVIVVDYGTATTYDYVSEGGVFEAGVTAPGIKISAKALSDFAANLPEIEIVNPHTILAKETISSMQAGIFYGQVGQTEHIITRMKQEIGRQDIKVIATGGLGDMISKSTDMIDIFNPNLTLEGLMIIYEHNKETKDS